MVEPTPSAALHDIQDHGIIGDMASAALVARDGTVDFMCWPRFDSPSVFARLLDTERGGEFAIRPHIADARNVQFYLPDTNVLLTRWMGEDGSAEIVDFMRPVNGRDGGGPQLVRRVTVTRGHVSFTMQCRPRFDYARRPGRARLHGSGACFDCEGDTPTLHLASKLPLQADGGDVRCDFALSKGEAAWFVLDDGQRPEPDDADIDAFLDNAVTFWRRWVAQSNYHGRWREMVIRSALALKLLTSREHGSIIAAATFGLPEAPGGERNWDYRFTWIRDASFTVYAFLRLGFNEEARRFNRWVEERIICDTDASGHLELMYRLDGGPDLEEIDLDHLAGHAGSRPVRVGNGAFHQEQLDIYGELLDATYLSNKYVESISREGWTKTCLLIDYVAKHWRQPDAGIWERRDGPVVSLHSRLMCWVAVDRALRLASKRSLPAPFGDWAALRNEIHEDIWQTFWSPELGRFVHSPGTDALDGSMLLMPLVRFVSASDPCWLATLDAIGRELADDALVHRYRGDDGLDGREGSFTPCSFWYVECLARAGRLDEACTAFEKLLAYANHLGLYAEELDIDGAHLGNFPQALTHLALISTAYFLDRELDGHRPALWRP